MRNRRQCTADRGSRPRLDSERSGAGGFEDMGEQWVEVRDAARNETLRASDPAARQVAARWEQFIEYLCLHLGQELGVDVKHLLPRGKSADERVDEATRQLAQDGTLQGAFRVPDAIGPVELIANLRTRQVTAAVDVDAPREGRPRTQVNWMLRQLNEAPDDLRVEVRFKQLRETTSLLLGDCQGDPSCLLLEDDRKREPRSFRLALSRPMGSKRGKKEGSFVAETKRLATDFYGEIVQDLTPARPRAPKLSEGDGEDQRPREEAARRAKERELREVAEAHEEATA